MEVTSFADIQVEFMERVSEAIYGVMATVDCQNRPRTPIMHFVWNDPIGWVISWPESYKAKHLNDNPAVSLAYIHNTEKPVYVDGIAEWIDTVEEKQRIWDLHRATTQRYIGR
ncbi:MAG: pyridoxamine 5'-phosphate oxidase family protein [Roseiflexaceae bacterium]|nr:pyridoxamine 5'-phosphate oxidase family protein [Roseiflexaceae bacterium]